MDNTTFGILQKLLHGETKVPTDVDGSITTPRLPVSEEGSLDVGCCYFDECSPDVVQDNAGPHTTRVSMNSLTACKTLPWSARSPDFSPIEHVWNKMGKRLYQPGNVDDLARQLEQISREIPQETIRVLYPSM
ncbi:transposable element Tcb1 transposase [Trichonephila clavipes]|nr:transposable element Tcb1 transposase [Trichonephila clavipes]